MLKLENIVKDYKAGSSTVEALRGVSIEFRKNEFVSVLGQSGCGKTTLLNIIGGLDRYTDGNLEINGVSTKKFKDKDWDAYRNYSIGFVFQTYNLIPHQTVLANVELALTLSGVSKGERRRRAVEALTKVGLGDQLKKKPNQMSGGQMQRVAIARALVNNPDILLADEPTGALDSETSVQIMEILKEIAQDKLIIMVTHNPELAEKYSTRIVRLLDGKITDDSNPYKSEPKAPEVAEDKKVRIKKNKNKLKSMSFFTALSLSLNNLMTKRARTFMTSFAGSIGIIGIALILSLSNGIQLYINSVEEDTLTSYPLAIEQSTVDMTALMQTMMGVSTSESEHALDKIYSNNVMSEMMNSLVSEVVTNNMKAFKEFIESDASGVDAQISGIKYTYATDMNIYKSDTENGIVQVNPSKLMEQMGMSTGSNPFAASMSTASSTTTNLEAWTELLDNDELNAKQYEVIAGRMPQSYDELILIADEKNEISDALLYSIGLMDQKELEEITKAALNNETYETDVASYTYDELLNITYKLITNTDYFQKQSDGTWADKSDDELYMVNAINSGITLKIVGIVRPSSDSLTSSQSAAIGYTADLMKLLVENVNKSEIVTEQKNNPDTDIFTGIKFATNENAAAPAMTMDDLKAYVATLPEEQQAEFAASMEQMQGMGMNEDKILEMFTRIMSQQSTDATYDENMTKLGVSDIDDPEMIMIYPKDFEAKEKIVEIIDDYNKTQPEENKIQYTDYIGLLMSSVTTIINAISYILIAFVSISLVVSSIMIGIITYISVLERTKEIGILRAIGASKKDISRVFNAETLIVGLCSGLIGIGVTILLTIPANIIIESLTEIPNVAQLPWIGGVILIIISMLLTFIAGLVPSKIAAKKDPVVALRTE